MKKLPGTFFLRSTLILLLTLSLTQIQAAIINVSPVASAIQNAVNGASAGDTLSLANGTYNESVNLANAAGDITILAANVGGATVNGGNASAFFAASHGDDVTISGLVLQSTSTDGNIGVVFFTDHTGRLSVSDCSFDRGGGIQIFTTGIKVENTAANNPTQLSILDNTFGPFENDELIQIETENAASGGDVDIVIDGNTNSGVLEDGGIEVDIDRNFLIAIVVIRNNNFGNWTGTGPGIQLRMDGENLQAHLLVEDNVITGPDGNGIILDCAAINSDIFAEIDGNTVAGNANTDTGIIIDDESSAHSTDITAFVSNNIVSNTKQSSIRVRPFNDIANTVNNFQVVIDGNNISNPNSDMTPVLEEAGVDISDDSGTNDERYVVDVEITNNTFSNINASTACILIEEPITMTHGTAVVEYLLSGNTGCTSPTINGSPTAVADPVPSSASLGSIGDFVWDDLNQDGDQDLGEPGVSGVVIAFTNGSLSGTTTTNSDGSYIIPSLVAGTYTLTLNPTAKLPFITDQGLGGDATKDSDFNPTSMQASVVLAAGSDNVDIDGGLKATNCPVISFTTSKIDEDCPGANNGSISFGIPGGGMAPYTFSVDSGVTYVMGSNFPGLTPGVYQTRVIDANGCESDATPVTIAAGVDITAPVITCPAGQTVYLGANCDASLGSYAAASVSDNCTSTPAVSQSPAASSSITANTTVVLTAMDASGNSDTCNIMIMVSDSTSPEILGGGSQMASLSASADAAIWEDNAGNNAGGNNFFHSGTSNGNSRRRALIKFDIASGIPAGATIDSVKLMLSISGGNSSNPSDYDLFPSLKDWGEGNKTGNTGSAASNGEVTWNSNLHNTSTWAMPGGQAGTDYANTASATTNVVGQGTYTWSGMITDVQSWLNSPAGNFGWFLISQSENVGGTARRFNTRENSSSQPVLEVYYTMPSSICGGNDTLFADTNCDASIPDYSTNVSASDNCGTPTITQVSPAIGSMLSTGTYPGLLEATDAAGNSSSCSFTVVVIDTIAPEITCPSDQSVLADTSGTVALGSFSPAMVADNCSIASVTQSPVGGTIISMNTIVTMTATDPSGNTVDCSFTVTVDTIVSNIDIPLASMDIQAYPNPTTGTINVRVQNSDNQPITAEVFDVNGRAFMRKTSATPAFMMDLNGLAGGVYFLKIRNKDGRFGWEKIVLE